MASKNWFVRGNISLLDMVQGDFRDERVKQALVRFSGEGIVLLRSDPEDRDHVTVVLTRGKKSIQRFYGLRKDEEREEDVRIPLSYLRGDACMEATSEEEKALLEELQEAVQEGCDVIHSKRTESAAATVEEASGDVQEAVAES